MLTTSYPRFVGDFGGSFVEGMARAFVARGHSVTVLAPPRRGVEKKECSGDPVRDGRRKGATLFVKRLRYPWPSFLPTLFGGTGAPDALEARPWLLGEAALFTGALARESRRLLSQVDAVVSHWLVPCGLTASFFAAHRPHVAVAHSSDVRFLARFPLVNQATQRLLGPHSRVMFSSEAVREVLCGSLHSSVAARVRRASFVQPMGVDVDSLRGGDRRATRRELGMRGFCVLFLGRLVPVKRPRWLLELAQRLELAHRLEEVTFVVAGRGPLEDPLKREVDRRGWGSHFRFLGAVDPERRRHLLAACDAMALFTQQGCGDTERTEGAPVVLMEAAVAGLPVVATRVGGVGEVVDPGRTGFLCSAHHPEEMGKALERLMENEPLRREFSKNARRMAERFSWKGVMDRVEPLLVV